MSQKGFVYVIKLKTLEWAYISGLLLWAQSKEMSEIL